MQEQVSREQAIRQIVKSSVTAFARGFSGRHLGELNDPDGTINMKIHNVFIAALGPEVRYYASMVRSLDSSLGNMLESMALSIAGLSFEVTRSVNGYLYPEQIQKIGEILEGYKNRNNPLKPSVEHFEMIAQAGSKYRTHTEEARKKFIKTHISDYCFYDAKNKEYYIIELKIGGDLDNKKARSEKEAILEQYAILRNRLEEDAKIRCYFATAYNRFGEDREWNQGRVLQFFSKDELLIGRDFWNFVCGSEEGYDIVIDEYKRNANEILQSLEKIKQAYLGEEE